jgi:DNA-directed RNA polymerase subunit RPC12/RpoP
MNMNPPYYIEVKVNNGAEDLSGCHPDRAYFGLRIGTSWTNPGRLFVFFRENGEIQTGGGMVLGDYDPGSWYTVKVKYELPDSDTVRISYWINDEYKGQEDSDAIDEEANLKYFVMTVEEGTAWFDAVNVWPAEPTPSEDSSFTDSVPLPSEVSTDPEVIGTNAGLALFFVIVFYFAATLFNSTIRDNYAIIQGWLGSIERPINRVTKGISSSNSKKSRYLIILCSVAIFALIYSFLDPYFTNGYGGLALFISLAIAIFTVTYTYEGIQVWLSGSSFHTPARVKILPIGIAVAIVFVLISRAIDFHPGLIYGFIGAYASLSAAKSLGKRQRAMTIILGAVFLIIFAGIAFCLREFTYEASKEGGGFWMALADGILVGIFVVGLEGLLFSFMPLTFMDGAKVAAWNRAVCATLLFVISFLFFWILIYKDKEGELAEAAGDMEFVMIWGMMALFLTLSGLTWLYFRRRYKPVQVESGKAEKGEVFNQPSLRANQGYCTNCGKKIEENSVYCSNCGQELINQETVENIKCPLCGSNTVIQTAKQGPSAGRQFHVCTRYPQCKGKIAVE